MADPAARRGAVFVVGVLVALFTGYAIGRVAVPPSPPSAAVHSHATGSDGLSASSGGYTLSVTSSSFSAGTSQPLRFTIRGTDGLPVRRYDVVHEKQLHLIVVREDLTGYQHLHPDLGPDGTWTTPLTLPTAGTWRMYTDFTATGGPPVVLGAILALPGTFTPSAPTSSSTVDGLDIRSELRDGYLQVRVTRAGKPVTPEPYLGAAAHLVALRETDLAYLHTHADRAVIDGAMRFDVGVSAATNPGRYRAWVEFSSEGSVHTAELSLTLP